MGSAGKREEKWRSVLVWRKESLWSTEYDAATRKELRFSLQPEVEGGCKGRAKGEPTLLYVQGKKRQDSDGTDRKAYSEMGRGEEVKGRGAKSPLTTKKIETTHGTKLRRG